MKKLILGVVWITFGTAAAGQAKPDENRLSTQLKLDMGLQGVGISMEPRLGNHLSLDLAMGAGGGYDVSPFSFIYEFNLLQPAFYLSATPKFYYNRLKRLAKQKTIKNNSGNYIGLRLKYTTPSIAPNDYLRQTGLINLHWGLQRPIGNRGVFNTHAGFGYAQSFGNSQGRIYPAIGVNFAYLLLKPIR
ncbi:MAG: hypothetical protein MUF62_11000 [Chitinophagaceae bacterium]|jgi:hypothetical protein|nr:hypothetical protein [Chitinophagaceae bacterium]